MLRGEESQQSFAAELARRRGVGRLIDNQGQVQYHIVTTWWANLVIAGFGVLLALCLILMIFIYQNKSSINNLEQKVDQNEGRLSTQEKK